MKNDQFYLKTCVMPATQACNDRSNCKLDILIVFTASILAKEDPYHFQPRPPAGVLQKKIGQHKRQKAQSFVIDLTRRTVFKFKRLLLLTFNFPLFMKRLTATIFFTESCFTRWGAKSSMEKGLHMARFFSMVKMVQCVCINTT